MKATANRRQEKRITAVMATALAALGVAGCTAEAPTAESVGLLGDLARQLLTFWVL